MKKLFFSIIVTSIIFTSCSKDDSNGVSVGGPSGGSDDVVNPGDPLLYTPSDNLKDIANYPIGNIVSASRLTSSSEGEFRVVLNKKIN